MPNILVALVVLAAIGHLLLGGAGVVRVAVQFPAIGRRLDPAAFARWSRATDMGNGLYLYPLLGIISPLASWAALAVALAGGAASSVRLPLILAAVLSVLHTFTTTQAAPAMLRLGRTAGRAEALTPLIERFVRWSWPRLIFQFLNGAVLVWALMAVEGSEPNLPPAVLASVLAALTFESILAGAALDEVVVHLPARQKVGTAEYAAYVRATGAANGRKLYPVVGALSNVTTIGAFIFALALRVPAAQTWLLGLASAGGVAALLLTRPVIPVMTQLAAAGSDSAPRPLLDQLDDGARARAPLFWLVFTCLLAALIV